MRGGLELIISALTVRLRIDNLTRLPRVLPGVFV